MPRPKLYHTKKERQAANRAKSKRSYEKNKTAILTRRHEVADSIKRHAAQARRKKEAASQVREARYRRLKAQSNCIRRAERERKRLADLMAPALEPRQFLDAVCLNYSRDKDARVVENYLAKIDEIHSNLSHLQDDFLQRFGLGDELTSLRASIHSCRELSKWLCDIYCATMEDQAGEEDRFNKPGGLEYQRQ